MHTFPFSHRFGRPEVHSPPSHVSPTVHGSPSSHGPGVSRVRQSPFWGSQTATVQGLLSSGQLMRFPVAYQYQPKVTINIINIKPTNINSWNTAIYSCTPLLRNILTSRSTVRVRN